MNEKIDVKYVPHLPDLITWDDYESVDERKVMRIRITLTEDGLEIIGDSPYAHLVEDLLAGLDPTEIDMMLCG